MWIFRIKLTVVVLLSGSCVTLGVPDNQDTYYELFFKKHADLSLTSFRLPEGNDLEYWGVDRDTYFYKTTDNNGNFKAPYWTKGDFNSDGLEDRAYILFNVDTDVGKVFAFVSDSKDRYRILEVSSATKFMAISTPNVLSINGNVDVLRVFALEGHGVIYGWDTDGEKFVLYD